MNAHPQMSHTDAMQDRTAAMPVCSGPTAAAALRPIKMFPANAEIYAEGDDATTLYEVAFGVVRLCRLLSDGRRQISAFHLPGEVFGFEAGDHRHFSAEAVSGCGLRIVEVSSETRVTQILPMALTALLRAQEHLVVVGRQSATERVAAFLLDMQARQGGQAAIELAMSRADVADYLGLTIETVSRTLTRLKDARLIRLKGARTVEFCGGAALQRLCA